MPTKSLKDNRQGFWQEFSGKLEQLHLITRGLRFFYCSKAQPKRSLEQNQISVRLKISALRSNEQSNRSTSWNLSTLSAIIVAKDKPVEGKLSSGVRSILIKLWNSKTVIWNLKHIRTFMGKNPTSIFHGKRGASAPAWVFSFLTNE